ncbi:unnamed protein product [Brachionus calyciflorus]|uniref:Phosphomevalonate kinase n=1 Tax=Brachionus calyciflorus TaxID=104777 RepID=A0A813ZHR8_9BILA|nr:unnamed protein product [Brachionus calyciflorus]
MNSYQEQSIYPNLVLLLSGKRKCGKDYVSNKLAEYFKNNEKVCLKLLTISAPLKKAYAKENNLDYEQLLDSSEYKEIYRRKMIEWSDLKREVDPGYFCRLAIENLFSTLYETKETNGKFFIILVTDTRRKTDLEFFSKSFTNRVKTIRVEASESTRIARNWIYTKGVDDVRSECDLDDVKYFDFKIQNNNYSEITSGLNTLIDFIQNLI